MIVSQVVTVSGVTSQQPGERFTTLDPPAPQPPTPAPITRGNWSETPSARLNGRLTTNVPPPVPTNQTRVDNAGTLTIQGPVIPSSGGYTSTALVTLDLPAYMGYVQSVGSGGRVTDDKGAYANNGLSITGVRWQGGIGVSCPRTVYFGWQSDGDYSPEIVFSEVFVGSGPNQAMTNTAVRVRIGGAEKNLTQGAPYTASDGRQVANFYYRPLPSEGQYLAGVAEWNFNTAQGYENGWWPWKMGPLAAFTVEGARFGPSGGRTFTQEGSFQIDSNPSIDIDGGIVSREFGVIKTGNVFVSFAPIAHNVSSNVDRYYWPEVLQFLIDSGYTTTIIPDTTPIPFVLRVTDNDGMTDGETASIIRGSRGGFIVRESNEIISRRGYKPLQHRGRGRVFSVKINSGLLERGDNEGGTWTTMSTAWSDVSGAYPLDMDTFGDGGFIALAKVGSNLAFRLSGDGVTWYALDANGAMIPYSTVGPYVTGACSLREHRSSDVGVITVFCEGATSAQSKTYRSTDTGMTSPWQEVTG